MNTNITVALNIPHPLKIEKMINGMLENFMKEEFSDEKLEIFERTIRLRTMGMISISTSIAPSQEDSCIITDVSVTE